MDLSVQEYAQTQQLHHQVASIIDFVPDFLSATFENWQSEYLQLFSFVVLTTYLIHKGSHESKDGDEQVQAALDQIEKKLAHIKQK